MSITAHSCRPPSAGRHLARGRRPDAGAAGRRRALAGPLLGLALVVVLPALAAAGLDLARLAAGELRGAGWALAGIDLELGPAEAAHTPLTLRIERLELDALTAPLEQLTVRCTRARLRLDGVSCAQLHYAFRHPVLGPQQGTGRLTLALGGRSRLQLAGLRPPGGGDSGRVDLAVDVQHSTGRWHLQVTAQDLDIAGLHQQAQRAGVTLPALQWEGRATLDLEARGRQTELQHLLATLRLRDAGFADASGHYLGAGLAARLVLEANARAAQWQGSLDARAEAGELLTPWAYLDVGAAPLRLAGHGALQPGSGQLQLHALSLDLGDLLSASGSATLALPPAAAETPVQRAQLRLQPVRLAALQAAMLTPVWLGTPRERLQLSGRVAAEWERRAAGDDVLRLDLQQVGLDDSTRAGQPRRLGLQGVSGTLHWGTQGPVPDSRLRIAGGHLLDHVPLGATTLVLGLQGDSVALRQPTRIPVFDGALEIDALSWQRESAGPALRFSGRLQPIPLAELTRALGWPALSGSLSGDIPALHYRAPSAAGDSGELGVDGTLTVRAFAGEIAIDRLRLTDVLGIYPILEADIGIRGLDLETLTETFAFGRITGRLDGAVNGLRLEAWQPVAFDARLHTPVGDRSTRRISQQAVDTLSNLGGSGASGAVARGLLGLFEEFRYARLGIGCRLRDGQCEMRGVEPAERGYYLVKGAGIPRIDIIGYNRTTDWQTLLWQLRQSTAIGSPVID